MVIQRLYEVLDDFVDQVAMLRDEFAESGDLKGLSSDTASAGSQGYLISRKVDEVITALRFNDDDQGRVPNVTDAQVASYEAACEALAKKFVGRNDAELDDLVQEGRIMVWLSLARGINPSAEMIENRMRDYVRWLGMLQGKRRYAPEDCEGEECEELNAPVPYEAMLPLDDFRTSSMLDALDSAGWLDVESRLG